VRRFNDLRFPIAFLPGAQAQPASSVVKREKIHPFLRGVFVPDRGTLSIYSSGVTGSDGLTVCCYNVFSDLTITTVGRPNAKVRTQKHGEQAAWLFCSGWWEWVGKKERGTGQITQ
jgi:hypothetical protein